MKKSFFIAALLLAIHLAGATAFPVRFVTMTKNCNWTSEVKEIPKSRPPLSIRLDYIMKGDADIFVWLDFLDADGKNIGKPFLARPPLHTPATETQNCKDFHVCTVLPGNYPVNAVKIRCKLRVQAPKLRKKSVEVEIQDVRIQWLYRMNGEKTANFFQLGELVRFRGELPPGMTGVKGTVYDSDGKKVAEQCSRSSLFEFQPKTPGFYSVRFAWLGKDGKEIPVSEDFYMYEFRHQEKSPIRRKRIQKFTRDMQNFAVTATAPRSVRECPDMFGFNILRENINEIYLLPREQHYAAIKLLGMNSHLRLHHLSWDDIEIAKGKYNWAAADHYMNELRSFGYSPDRVLLNTFGTPRWNSPRPENVAVYQTNFRFFAPKDMTAWHDYIHALCKRYLDLKQIELWDEPHLPGGGGSIFWQDSTPEQFVELMKQGYAGAKKANPNITVVMGGIAPKRYIPFYDEFVRLGGLRYFDVTTTHNGLDCRPLQVVDKKYGVQKQKPYWEDEWHTVLYNCRIPEIPSEEEVTFRMLVNFADLIHIGHNRITGFGLMTGPFLPETARFCAKSKGIQQVSGLFRSVPFLEPRLAALALRVATDRFSGKIKPLGAWNFGGDAAQHAALFESDSGKVMFLWTNDASKSKISWHPALLVAARGKNILDWEGRKTSIAALRPHRVYYVLNPDSANLAKAGRPLVVLTPAPKQPELNREMNGSYAPLATPVFQEMKNYSAESKRPKAAGFSARFAADLNRNGLSLIVKVNDKIHHSDCRGMNVWEADSVQFAIDAEAQGYNVDAVEFAIGKNGLIYKTKTPELKGDIPVEFSEANVPLTKSKAVISRRGGVTTYQIEVAASDLYPFVYGPGKQLRFSILVNNNDGQGREGFLEWGSGIGSIKNAAEYGTLYPTAGGKTVAEQKNLKQVFQDAKITRGNPVSVEALSGKRGAGVVCSVPVLPGSRVIFSGLIRGKGLLELMCYGKILRRTDFKLPPLTGDWQPFSGTIAIPAEDRALQIVFFTWRDSGAKFEIKDFKAINL